MAFRRKIILRRREAPSRRTTGGLSPRRRPFQVERQQPRQRVLLAYIVRPAIGRRNRPVEVAMRVVEPRRALVVQIGQCSLLQDRRGPRIDQQDAVGITRHDFRLAPHQIRRVQPRLAQLIEPPRRLGDRHHPRVIGVLGGREVRRQPLGEGMPSRLGEKMRNRRESYVNWPLT
jgi:hypothetical protein